MCSHKLSSVSHFLLLPQMFVKSKANVCFCQKKKKTHFFDVIFPFLFYSRFFSLFSGCLLFFVSVPLVFFSFNFPEINKIVKRIFRRIYFDVCVRIGRKTPKKVQRLAKKSSELGIKKIYNAILIMFRFSERQNIHFEMIGIGKKTLWLSSL